jgi:hypothetical protein
VQPFFYGRRYNKNMTTSLRPHAWLLLASCLTLSSALAGNHGGATARRAAAPLPRYGMTVYSDLCVSPGSGEYGGQRITLQRFAEVDTVIYEFTAGALSWPLVASEVHIDPRGKQLYFTVQVAEDEERTLNGHVSDDGQTLTLDGGYCEDQSQPMVLSKVRDFGAKPKPCKACPATRQHRPPAELKPEPAPPMQG